MWIQTGNLDIGVLFCEFAFIVNAKRIHSVMKARLFHSIVFSVSLPKHTRFDRGFSCRLFTVFRPSLWMINTHRSQIWSACREGDWGEGSNSGRLGRGQCYTAVLFPINFAYRVWRFSSLGWSSTQYSMDEETLTSNFTMFKFISTLILVERSNYLVERIDYFVERIDYTLERNDHGTKWPDTFQRISTLRWKYTSIVIAVGWWQGKE